MLKNTFLVFTAFLLLEPCKSKLSINEDEIIKDLDWLLKTLKNIEGPCSSNPCLNSGGCKVDEYTFSCECIPPYKGKHCEKGPCTSSPCFNDGSCRVVGLNFKCECHQAYKGKQCEIKKNTVLTTSTTDSIIPMNTTYQNIIELNDSDNMTFYEPTAFTSDIIETTTTDLKSAIDLMYSILEQGNPYVSPKEFCENDTDCLNGGVCRKLNEYQHSCACAPYFGGNRCEVILPCVNLDQSCRMINAVCVLIDDHAICECPNGTLYHRKSGLCEDICDPRKCLNGKCEIIGNSYKCNCDQGYTGSHCDEKEGKKHENFVPWFTVIASINLFMCVLLIGMFCVICSIKRFIMSV